MGELRGVLVRITPAEAGKEGDVPALMTIPTPLNWQPARTVSVPLAGAGARLLEKATGRRVYVLIRNLNAANVVYVQPGPGNLAQGKTIDARDHFIISSTNEWWAYCPTAAVLVEVMTADLELEGGG